MKRWNWVLGTILLFSLTLGGCVTWGPSPMEKNLRAQIEKLKVEKQTLAQEKNALEAEADRLTNETARIKTDLSHLQRELAQERDKTKTLATEIASLEKGLQSLIVETVPGKGQSRTSQELVKKIQLALNAAGFDPGKLDGVMGPATNRAIREFQKAHGLKVDGKVGPKTWRALQKYLRMK